MASVMVGLWRRGTRSFILTRDYGDLNVDLNVDLGDI